MKTKWIIKNAMFRISEEAIETKNETEWLIAILAGGGIKQKWIQTNRP